MILAVSEVTEAQEAAEEELEDDNSCVVCLAEKRSYLILPCAHLCLCAGCATSRAWDACPMCRADATKMMRVFT